MRVRVIGVDRFDHSRPRDVYAIDSSGGDIRLLVASDEGRLRWVPAGQCVVAGYTEGRLGLDD
ncbi:MAG: hypothetical protein QN146_02530 [Armatimonadota bacterium]|nr:hypothetical protein [Armatimonadota bacterium]MDR7509656.1 hypothetical protein [Armatimonadota bacterium]